MITGIISGLLVTLFVVVFRAGWTRIIVPWFEERVYKDARIEGTWFSLYPLTGPEKRRETVTLKRHGHSVTCDITCISGEDKGEAYVGSGSFRNMILPLVYEAADPTKTDRGSITLKLVANAKRFVGNVSCYNDRRDSIEVLNVIWFRSQTDLENRLKEIAAKEAETAEHVDQLNRSLQEAEAARAQKKEPVSPERPSTAPSTPTPAISEPKPPVPAEDFQHDEGAVHHPSDG